MNDLRLENVDIDERAWKKWVQKGKDQDQLRKRKWRIIAGIATALFCVAAGLYAFMEMH